MVWRPGAPKLSRKKMQNPMKKKRIMRAARKVKEALAIFEQCPGAGNGEELPRWQQNELD